MKAHAKINLALVVGERRPDGLHAVETVLQRVELHDVVELEPAPRLAVEGFAADTLVRASLEAIARAAGVQPAWRARIEKRIPVAAGLGGGSADAAAALVLGNATLASPLPEGALLRIASAIGSDVPFFLGAGPKLATGTGTELEPLELPLGYSVLLVLPRGAGKGSTASVYRAFDAHGGAAGFSERCAFLRDALARIREPDDLARLPANDLASSPLAAELRRLGAFRADVSGAGPAVYGLFDSPDRAAAAADALRDAGRSWITRPVP